MSIKRLSGAGLTTPKTNKLWDQTTFQSGMFALATVSLTTTASSITFSGIPSGYTQLHLRAMTRCTQAAGGSDILIRFNGDSSSNYSYHFVQGGPSGSAAGGGSANYSSIRHQGTADVGQGAATWDVHIFDVLDYTSTSKVKTLKALAGGDYNGNGYARILSGAWFKNTSSVYEAITQIDLVASGTTFVTGSTFCLYGIKGA